MLQAKLLTAAIILFAIGILSGCNNKYDSVKQIDVQTNFDTLQTYVVTPEVHQQEVQKNLKVIVMHKGKVIHEILLGANRVKLDVLFEQQGLPFSLFKGYAIDGNIAFIPKNGRGKTINLPLEVYIKPWVMTHIEILIIVFGLATLLFFANLMARFVLLPASGRIDIIYPNNLVDGRIIYPPSLINHFIRNRYTIGSGKNDQWVLNGEKFNALKIKKGLISLRFLKRGKENYVAIKSAKRFYYKEGEPQLKKKETPAEKYGFQKVEKVADYKVEQFVEETTQSQKEAHFINCGYHEANKTNLSCEKKKIVLIYGAGDLVFQIETPSR